MFVNASDFATLVCYKLDGYILEEDYLKISDDSITIRGKGSQKQDTAELSTGG